MTPYINNNPFVTSITNAKSTKDADNTLFILIGGIVLIGGAICIYNYQKKKFNKVIINLKTENEILKAALIV